MRVNAREIRASARRAGRVGRAALRQRLAQLRKTAGLDLTGSTTTLQLDACVGHDLMDSEEPLGDLRLPDAPELDVWLQAQRE